MEFVQAIVRAKVAWQRDEITHDDYLAFLKVSQELANKWGVKFPKNVLPVYIQPTYPDNMEA